LETDWKFPGNLANFSLSRNRHGEQLARREAPFGYCFNSTLKGQANLSDEAEPVGSFVAYLALIGVNSDF
jgi:hypothetical protein